MLAVSEELIHSMNSTVLNIQLELKMVSLDIATHSE